MQGFELAVFGLAIGISIVRLVLFGLVLAACAWQDWKRKEVSDLLAGTLWLLAVLSLRVEAIAVLAVAFPCLVVLNWAFLQWKGKACWGWGDVLIIPPVFAQLYVAGQPILMILAIVAPMLVGGHFKREEEPLAPYLLAAFLLSLFL